jgi:hypothetical protein
MDDLIDAARLGDNIEGGARAGAYREPHARRYRHRPAQEVDTRNEKRTTRDRARILREGYLAHKKQRPPRKSGRTMPRALW